MQLAFSENPQEHLKPAWGINVEFTLSVTQKECPVDAKTTR
jgi:hypothetical protein